MSSIDHHSALGNPVTELVSHSRPSLNQQVYLRLRLALSLNLRRQIFVAVCDDVTLRDQFATQLAADLSSPARKSKNGDNASNGQTNPSLARLVSLNLYLPNPDVHAQVNQWLSQHTDFSAEIAWIPNFQIIGIDRLTRQPVHIQRSFLNSLHIIGQRLPTLNFNVLLWVTRPWCRSIQQSVPDFWRWHTAIFEFEGDPTPLGQDESQKIGGMVQRKRPVPPAQPPASSLPPKASAPSTPASPSTPPSTPSTPPSAPSVPVRPQVAPIVQLPKDELTQLVLASIGQKAELSENHELSDSFPQDRPSFEPIRLLQQLENQNRTNDAAATLVATYRQLGDWYRDRLDTSRPSAQHLTIVIRSYEKVLKLTDPRSAQVPDLLNDIGNLYWMMARCPEVASDAVENLEKALKTYQFAIERLSHPEQEPTTPENQAITYAMIQNNLGSLYSDLAQRQDTAENLQHSINAYRESLKYRSVETDAARYAATLNNLGTAYWNLAQHQQPMANLQDAIAVYNEALNYYNPEQDPLHYAMIQNNLGTAYWNLAQCEDATQQLAMAADFLQLAIGAYRVALVYRTFEAAPSAYAATQNNLGTAYWHLATQPTTHFEDRQMYLLCAIDAYEEAIKAAERLAAASSPQLPVLNFDVSATHHNLGSAYQQVAIDERSAFDQTERSEFLQKSLQHQIRAWHGWQDHPDFCPNAVNGILQSVRAIHDQLGIQGQTAALSNIPPSLLPIVMKGL